MNKRNKYKFNIQLLLQELTSPSSKMMQIESSFCFLGFLFLITRRTSGNIFKQCRLVREQGNVLHQNITG